MSQERIFDLRLLEKKRLEGKLSASEYEAFLNTIPDDANNFDELEWDNPRQPSHIASTADIRTAIDWDKVEFDGKMVIANPEPRRGVADSPEEN